MPNLCSNSLKLTHTDPAMIDRAVTAYKNENLFQEFVPMPEGEENWYNWNIENWSTKWQPSFLCDPVIDNTSVSLSFDTAWSPPISFYDAMEQLGFGVEAYYNEPGMGFCGVYKDGDEECFEYSNFDEIPDFIVEKFDLEDWEEEEE